MDPTRPLAQKRLDRALEIILSDDDNNCTEFSFSDLRRKLDIISQEKRFILVLYLMRESKPRTDYEIATEVRDSRSNVARNLYVLVSEKIVLASREEITKIAHYQINHRTMMALSDLLRPSKNLSVPA